MAFLEERARLKETQRQERTELQRRQEMQGLDIQRKIRALDKVDKRELKSLEEALKKEARIYARGGRGRMPSLALELTPPGRRAVPHKAKNRHNSEFAREKFAQVHDNEPEPKELDLSSDFEHATDDGSTGKGGESSAEGRKPTSRQKIRRYGRKRKRDNGLDRGR
jgi:hypothetical protein